MLAGNTQHAQIGLFEVSLIKRLFVEMGAGYGTTGQCAWVRTAGHHYHPWASREVTGNSSQECEEREHSVERQLPE